MKGGGQKKRGEYVHFIVQFLGREKLPDKFKWVLCRLINPENSIATS
jgi:hypothetical protein